MHVGMEKVYEENVAGGNGREGTHEIYMYMVHAIIYFAWISAQNNQWLHKTHSVLNGLDHYMCVHEKTR